MLTESFVHVAGVGLATERALWDQGCAGWDAWLAEPSRFDADPASREMVTRELERSRRALAFGEHQYFAKKLRQRYAWRALTAFPDRTVYLDIETDGGNGPDPITTVGLYDGANFRCLVRGEDLHEFPDVISHYAVVVTFFGAGFDLPVLQKQFPYAPLDQIHIDLHPVLRDLGFRGGLKLIEQTLGIERSPETQGLTGRDAVWLWRDHVRGRSGALERLIAYNREDVVNLERLGRIAYDKLVAATRGGTLVDLKQPRRRAPRIYAG